MVRRPGLYSLIDVLIVGGLSLTYANLEPRYRLADQVPDREQAVSASHRLDTKLNGANPIDVLIEFPSGTSLYAPETLATITEVHATLEKQPGIANVWSLETLRRWLAEKVRRSDTETLKQCVDMLPSYLTRRFISAEQDAVLVSGRVPDLDASQLLPVIDGLDKALDGVRARHPGYKIAVTGLSAIAARNSAIMIRKLNRGLTLEFLFVAAFIGIAFRSVVVTLATILPGIFPVVLAGSVLSMSRTAVRQRCCADGLIWVGAECHHSLSQSSTVRRQTGSRRCGGGSASHGVGRAPIDSDVHCARVRTGGNGLLQSPIAASVRLAERIFNALGPGRRSFDSSTDHHVPRLRLDRRRAVPKAAK
jgi:hypothetical protein